MIVNEDILKWCEEYTGEPFHAVFCDPPYELGFMGKKWDSTGIAFDKNTWAAISRHLYPGAYLLAFGGTRTFHRIAVAIEDAGFEIRDTVMWVYGSGFPKSHNVSIGIDKAKGLMEARGVGTSFARKDMGDGLILENGKAMPAHEGISDEAKQWSGYGTALKPSWEPVIIARKPLEGTVAQNTQKYGSGALNIDGCRVGHNEETKVTTRTGRSNASVMNDESVGFDNTKNVMASADPLGRWPANLIHDGSDEVVGMFPNTGAGKRPNESIQHGTSIFGGKSKTETKRIMDDAGSAARFFYSAKVSKRERDAGLEGFLVRQAGGLAGRADGSLGGEPVTARNHHPTLKPIALTTYLAKLILPPKLDKPRRLLVPFAGSGSEVIGGYLAGWDEVLGVEREKEYAEIAEARIKHWTKSSPQPSSSSTSVPPESTDTQEILDI